MAAIYGSLAKILDFRIQIKSSVLQVFVELAASKKISNMHIRNGNQVHFTVNPGHIPHILIFQVRAVRITINLHSQGIFTWLKILRQIEFRRAHRALAVTHKFAVQPQIERRFYARKMDKDLLPMPIIWDRERSPVRTHFVIVRVDIGRIFLPHPFDTTIAHIMWRTITLELPLCRDRDLIPRGNIETGLVEILGAVSWSLHPMKFPLSVQGLNPRGGLPCSAGFQVRVISC